MSMRLLRAGVLVAALLLGLSANTLAGSYLEQLQPDQVVHGFRTLNVYENGAGRALGARFISERYSFLIDVMEIQSVPQAFFWVKTPITTSKGEPHACEHLLLGKGNRGRYVSALEDMALSSSTAYTQQYRTCYHYNTVAGESAFFGQFEARLQALLHPDFADEEIQREVCHLGVTENPETGTLSLEEKGTVYTEMVSGFERSYYHTWRYLNLMVYGENHPLSLTSGGDPDVMRSMTPQDMWDFHKRCYHLSQMGAIVSLPSSMPPDRFLERLNGILASCQDWADSSSNVGISKFDFPPLAPDPIGSVKLTTYPSDKPQDPGYILFGWPCALELNLQDEFMLDVFTSVFGSDQTSNLYRAFINSETRKTDIGASSIYLGYDDDIKHQIYLGIEGVDNTKVTREMIDSVLGIVRAELRTLASLEPRSAELDEFNQRAQSYLISWRKQAENQLNMPPMFGFRSGPSGAWLSLMEYLEKEPGFRKSLIMKERFDAADSLLSLDKNIWKEYIDKFQLLTVEPYAVGSTPSDEWYTLKAAEKEARMAGHIENLKQEFGTTDAQLAVAKYKEAFDARTASLEAAAAKTVLPEFTKQPPMTLDDELVYETMSLDGDVPLVASTFENMTSSEVGLCLRLDAVPESMMVFLPLLPKLLTGAGVTKDGQLVTYEEMSQRLQREVLGLNANFSSNVTTGRVELVLSGRAANTDELLNSLDWMKAALTSPYIDESNLPRLVDIVDQALMASLNTKQGSEESWVNIPANAYRQQRNPLWLATNCFLTQAHQYHRLKWMLTDPGDKNSQAALSAFLDKLHDTCSSRTMAETLEILAAVETADASQGNLSADLAAMPESTRLIATKLAQSLKVSLGAVPEATFAADWDYLCAQTKADLLKPPAETIADLNAVLGQLRHADNARTYMVSNSADREAAFGHLQVLVATLSPESTPRQGYAKRDRVIDRLRDRHPGLEKPTYVGLLHEGTRNGVLVFSAKAAGVYDTSSEALLNCLSGQLYGGGGPHGLFMRTWAAGLAYSNGYGYGEASGNLSYYAERCPDVAETMRFVVNELKTAEADPGLATYAMAQVFNNSRAPSRYEARGRAIAEDLVDGFHPDKVRAFRTKVLDVCQEDGLYEKLRAHMESAYGPVLIGYGEPLSKSREGSFFLIGPEPQFESLETYIKQVEEPQQVYRLYARDFWLTE